MVARKALFVAVAIAVFGLISGCKKDDSTNPITPAATGTSYVMIVHSSPNAPGVDILVDNAVAKTNLTFPANTGYVPVGAGNHDVKVNVTGTSTTALAATVALTDGAYYTVFAADSVSKISAIALVDTLTTPAAGKAHIRFIHLSPNAPAVDVAVTGGPVLFGNKSFKASTSFTPVAAATYNLEVRLAGTTSVVLSLPGITLQAGKIYTVFARGFVGGTGAQALGAEIIVNK
jgi:hypothetical protein